MKIPTPVMSADVAVLDARELFVGLPLPEGGHGVFCRACGAEARLDAGGLVDLRSLSHSEDCAVGVRLAPILAGTDKPVYLRHAATYSRH